MNVRNCKKCGKLFNHIMGMPICPACKDALEKSFQEVKKYIRENRMADIMEVAEACEVEVSQIKQWIREDRLEFTEDSPEAALRELRSDDSFRKILREV